MNGWVKVFSHTEPRANILGYRPWLIDSDGSLREVEVVDGRAHGKGVVARLAGVDDRDAAAPLIGATIAIRRAQLAELEPGEYYYADLEGLEVVTVEGVSLGQVDHLFETGANPVMVVRGERERLLPFVHDTVVREVDLAARRIRVDWDPEF